MALNFTGRQLPAPQEPPKRPLLGPRAPVMIVACFGIAAMLGGLVFLAALRQHKADTPPPLPALVGIDAAAQTPPRPIAPLAPAAARPAWIEHKAAPTPTAAPAPPPAPPPVQDRAQAEAAAKARMLAALRQVPHGEITLSVEDDPLAQAYAAKLKSLFREAGWTVDETSVFGSGPPRRGLAAAFGVSPADEAAREAFDAVGFQFLPPPRDSISRTPEIFVGVPVRAAPARPSPAPAPDARP
jgi:hypothetical protein